MKNTFSLLIVSVIFLAACATPMPAPEPTVDPAGSTMPALTEPSQPITVKAGETFMIVVESNPSTGYHWEIVGDLNGVELVSREYTAGEPVIPGSGGVDVWFFNAVSSGETTITLGNYPPGINEGDPEQAIPFTVMVED